MKIIKQPIYSINVHCHNLARVAAYEAINRWRNNLPSLQGGYVCSLLESCNTGTEQLRHSRSFIMKTGESMSLNKQNPYKSSLITTPTVEVDILVESSLFATTIYDSIVNFN